jgi:hypothetical protein
MRCLVFMLTADAFVSCGPPIFPKTKNGGGPSHPRPQEVWHIEQEKGCEDGGPDDSKLDLPFRILDVGAKEGLSVQTG